MKNFFSRLRSRRGFTLVEILVAVGIVAVLTGIAIPTVSTVSKTLDQKQLDDYAKTVYLAAQDNLTSMRKDGTLSRFSEYTAVPEENNAGFPYKDSHQEDEEVTEYVYVLSGSTGYSEVVPATALDSVVYSGYSSLIEFNKNTGDVYAVFLVANGDRGLLDYDALTDLGEIRESAKLRKNNHIGYYNGSVVVSAEDVNDDNDTQASVELVNGQECMVEVYIPIPSQVGSNLSDFAKSITSINITVTGELSGSKLEFDMFAHDITCDDFEKISDSEILYTCPLQSLVDDSDWLGKKSSQTFTIGENVTTSAKVECTYSGVDIEDSSEVSGNPWFKSLDNGTLTISNGRNLQNLNSLTSAIAVTEVVFEGDIYWNDTVSYYAEEYGSNKVTTFRPIDLEAFFGSESTVGSVTLKGNNFSIYYLNVNDVSSDETNTGLFRVFNARAENLVLKNPIVRGSNKSNANTGAFAGVIGSGAQLTNVSVQLSDSGEYEGSMDAAVMNGTQSAYATSDQTWIGVSGCGSVGVFAGKNAGTVNSISVSANGGAPVSGTSFGVLVGNNTGSITVTSAEAKLCYGKANTVGGLVGTNTGILNLKGTEKVTVTNVGAGTFGGIVGANENGTITGDGTVALNATLSGTNVAGGIAGTVNKGKVEGLTVTAAQSEVAAISLTSSNDFTKLGGIAGEVSGSASLNKNTVKDATFTVTGGSAVEAGGLVGHASETLDTATMDYKNTKLNVTATMNAYVGGLVGLADKKLTNVQLNAFADQEDSSVITVTSANAYVGGLAGHCGLGCESANLLSSKSSAGTLKLVVAKSSDTTDGACVGGLVGMLGSNVSLTNCVLQVEDGETGKDAIVISVEDSVRACVGGLTAQLTGTAKGCTASNVDITVDAKSAYAGGAVALCSGTLGGSGDMEGVTVSGTLTLASGAGTADKAAGGAVACDQGGVYTNVSSDVTLSGWGGLSAGSSYTDPSGLGVSVGQFVGSVTSGKFTDCTSAQLSGSYQFLGTITCGSTATLSEVRYGSTSSDPAQYNSSDLDTTFASVDEYATYLEMSKRASGSYYCTGYSATLNNCVYRTGSGTARQVISTEYLYKGAISSGETSVSGTALMGIVGKHYGTTVTQNNAKMSSGSDRDKYRFLFLDINNNALLIVPDPPASTINAKLISAGSEISITAAEGAGSSSGKAGQVGWGLMDYSGQNYLQILLDGYSMYLSSSKTMDNSAGITCDIYNYESGTGNFSFWNEVSGGHAYLSYNGNGTYSVKVSSDSTPPADCAVFNMIRYNVSTLKANSGSLSLKTVPAGCTLTLQPNEVSYLCTSES